MPADSGSPQKLQAVIASIIARSCDPDDPEPNYLRAHVIINNLIQLGFAIVPVEPTEAMIETGKNSSTAYADSDEMRLIWRAMVEAALK